MKIIKTSIVLLIVLSICILSCQTNSKEKRNSNSLRPLKDTIGFAQYTWQMDSLMARMNKIGWHKTEGNPWKLVICPHDDYTYVGKLYPEVLENVKAKNLILIGVAHKAAQLKIEDSLVFDTYKYWKGPWKNVPVSPAREQLFNILKGRYAILSDTLQKVEHSVESLVPFLQYFNKNIEIIPIIVPAMSPERMNECGKALAEAISTVAGKNNWEWGKDYAIIVTTDAVHYGNQDWGGIDRAYFGCDEKGNHKAMMHEAGIIDSCLTGELKLERIKLFSTFTLNPENFREYKWTWCGRYSIPVALYTAYYLNSSNSLKSEFLEYSTSITSNHIPVDDIRMGRTAIATDCHWVGYAALGFR